MPWLQCRTDAGVDYQVYAMRANLIVSEEYFPRNQSAVSRHMRCHIPINRTATAECYRSCAHLSDGRVGRGHVVDRRSSSSSSSSGVICCTTLSLEVRTIDRSTAWTWGVPVYNLTVHLLGLYISWREYRKFRDIWSKQQGTDAKMGPLSCLGRSCWNAREGVQTIFGSVYMKGILEKIAPRKEGVLRTSERIASSAG